MNLWVTGQLESAKRSLSLVDTPLLTASGMVPEFAFYDCFGCHHAIDKASLRWSRERAGSGIGPGTLRLQHQNLLMLRAVVETIAPDTLAGWDSAIEELVRAGQSDPAGLRLAAQKLLERLRAHDDWSSRTYSVAEVARVRKTLVQYAGMDKASDFASAEQVVLGTDSLSHTLNDYDQRKRALDALYERVQSPTTFNPAQFADAARRVAGQF
jgi:hypothetical protein